MLFAILLALIFFTLSIIHFNWARGGTFGFAQSLPTTESGERILNPRKIDSAVVGLGLLAFGLFYLAKAELFRFDQIPWIFKYGGWIIPIIFLLRAIGDFKYVGFFKSVKQTEFAKLDSKLFSPLCLGIGILGLVIHLTN